ncbi:hypothetical protein L9F63_019787, partial [Diploptera punctata]
VRLWYAHDSSPVTIPSRKSCPCAVYRVKWSKLAIIRWPLWSQRKRTSVLSGLIHMQEVADSIPEKTPLTFQSSSIKSVRLNTTEQFSSSASEAVESSGNPFQLRRGNSSIRNMNKSAYILVFCLVLGLLITAEANPERYGEAGHSGNYKSAGHGGLDHGGNYGGGHGDSHGAHGNSGHGDNHGAHGNSGHGDNHGNEKHD